VIISLQSKVQTTGNWQWAVSQMECGKLVRMIASNNPYFSSGCDWRGTGTYLFIEKATGRMMYGKPNISGDILDKYFLDLYKKYDFVWEIVP